MGDWSWLEDIKLGFNEDELALLPGRRYVFPQMMLLQTGKKFEIFTKHDDELWYLQPVEVWYYRGRWVKQNGGYDEKS